MLLAFTALGLFLALAWPSATLAQEKADGRGFWRALAGTQATRARVVPGFWVLHPFDPQFPELDPTLGGGLQFRGIYLGAFDNSYDRVSLIAGLERVWWVGRLGSVGTGVGYRTGLISGYDEQLIGVARYTPVLPFVGLLGWFDVGPVGVDLFYLYRAISLEASLSLDALGF